MKRGECIISIIHVFSICLIALAFITCPVINAAERSDNSSTTTRYADWYESQYGSGPFGQTWMVGRYGPDYGIGEQGYTYQSYNPLTGSFVNYSSSGLGMGLGGPLLGYQGMFSPMAQISYGPFSYGQNPQVAPTPGWSTQGYTSGSAFGNYSNFYQAQPMFGLMGGLFGGLGYGGLGGFGWPMNVYYFGGF
ncbi:MAG: hypothetical protein ACMUIA_00625 [bacterium]